MRVLLSKQDESDDYPSDRQTAPAQIEVQVKVVDASDPAGSMVYFRLVDPKDPSKYLNGHKDDNLPTSPAGQITPSAVVAPNGIATAILTIDPQYGGNNYRIEASRKPPPGFKKSAESKLYTAWKRFYIEHDKMYKQGEFLTQTSGAGQPNPARVFVANPGIFAPGDAVHILSGDSIATSEGEFGIIALVGAAFVDLQSPLALSYSEPLDPPNNILFPYSFLARIASGFFDAHPSTTELATTFDDTFVEWYLLATTGFVPHWAFAAGTTDELRNAFLSERSFLFFDHFNRSDGMPFMNYVQLVSASRFEESPPITGAVLGLTEATNSGGQTAFNWSWIFADTITSFAPSNLQNVSYHVAAHELGHQLNVNQGNPLGKGHDGEDAWGVPILGCLMNATTPPDTTSVRRLHASLTAPSQDLYCIRTHVDDLNQDQCPAFPGTTP